MKIVIEKPQRAPAALQAYFVRGFLFILSHVDERKAFARVSHAI
jgi:hypothetical protein